MALPVHMEKVSNYIKISFFCALQWGFNVLLTTTIKSLVGAKEGSLFRVHYPHPFMLTFLINIPTFFFAFLIASIGSSVFYVQSGRRVQSNRSSLVKLGIRGFFNFKVHLGIQDFLKGLLPIGLMLGIEHGLSNFAFKLLPVFLKVMIQSCSSAPVLLSSWMLGLEKLTFKVQFVLLLVVGGGILSSYSQKYNDEKQQKLISWLGLSLAVLCIVVQGIRVSFTQEVFRRRVNLSFTEEKRQDVLSTICDSRATTPLKEKQLLSELLKEDVRESIGLWKHPSEPPWQCVSADSEVDFYRESRSRSHPIIPYAVFEAVKEHAGLKVGYVGKPEMLMWTTPCTAAVCLLLALVFEGTKGFDDFFAHWRDVGAMVLLCAVFGMVKLILDLRLIQLTSAFVFILTGVLSDLLVAVSGVLLFQEHVALSAWLGFGITSLGMMLYAWSESQDADPGG